MKLRVVRWLGRRVFPAGGIRARAYPGVELWLHPRDWIEYLILRGDAYEPRTLDFIAANLRPGDVAMLAGVNFGLHAVVAARAVGSTGRVIGVEPQPAARRRAADNLELNALANRVEIVDAALGAHDGQAKMAWADSANPGAASLFDTGDGFVAHVRPIADIVLERRISAVRLLLLDVQGYESFALAGLGALRPDIVAVEVDPPFLAKAGVTPEALAAQLAELGYALHDLSGALVGPAGPAGGWRELPERNLIGVASGVAARWNAPPADRVSYTVRHSS